MNKDYPLNFVADLPCLNCFNTFYLNPLPCKVKTLHYPSPRWKNLLVDQQTQNILFFLFSNLEIGVKGLCRNNWCVKKIAQSICWVIYGFWASWGGSGNWTKWIGRKREGHQHIFLLCVFFLIKILLPR